MFAYLRQATASQSRMIGPFLDDTDFKTPEEALSLAATDIKLMANGGVSANKNSGGATHRVSGMYSITLDDTDTATVGELTVLVFVAGALAVVTKFWVLEEAVYDALFGASAAGYGTAQTGDSFARLGAPAGASVSADVAAVKVDTAATLADTGTDGVVVAAASKTDYTLSATGSAALTEGYAADGATATLPQLLYLITALLSEFSISGTTLTAKKLDGSTTAATFTLDDATNPTGIARAS